MYIIAGVPVLCKNWMVFGYHESISLIFGAICNGMDFYRNECGILCFWVVVCILL